MREKDRERMIANGERERGERKDRGIRERTRENGKKGK